MPAGSCVCGAVAFELPEVDDPMKG